jgi:hypothetical protein
MPRTRMTWTATPTKKATQGRSASPPPQTPSVGRTEGPDHPAYYPDPDRDKYEKGDTSSWAEDPKSPMIPESAPPAMPGNLTTEPLDHPATSEFEQKADKPGKTPAAKEASLKELAERRAAVCLRIASALMPGATVEAVESRAVDLMDLDDAKLRAAAEALTLVAGENPFEKKDDDEDEKKDDDDGSDKKASIEITARIDRLEAKFGKLRKAMAHFFGMDDKEDAADEMMAYLMGKDEDGDGIDQSKNSFPQGYDVDKLSGKEDDEDAMLKAMLDEMDDEMKTATHEQDVVEPLAKGQSIQSGEGGNVDPDAAPKTPQVSGPMTGGTAVQAGEMPDFIKEKMEDKDEKDDEKDEKDKTAADCDDDKKEEDTENDIEVTAAGDDPMGLMSDVTASDDELLQLYSDIDLGRVAGDEEVVEEEVADDAGDVEEVEEVEKAAAAKTARTASTKPTPAKPGKPQMRPQPRTASTGAAPKQLGTVSRVAREIDDLTRLWDSAPDVSAVFGVPKS